LESISNPTPHLSTQLHCRGALAHVGEYVRTICALTLSTPAAPFNETIGVLCFLHSLFGVDFPLFVDDFHLEMQTILNWKTFVSALTFSPCLSFGGPLGMVYGVLQ